MTWVPEGTSCRVPETDQDERRLSLPPWKAWSFSKSVPGVVPPKSSYMLLATVLLSIPNPQTTKYICSFLPCLLKRPLERGGGAEEQTCNYRNGSKVRVESFPHTSLALMLSGRKGS